ncbi:hypothetical protein C0993_006230 [Termitomyces sp. T159_Od127]|nr:hypothetical protein C0993_006230 [Termitomyces sp. T159_Od127]
MPQPVTLELLSAGLSASCHSSAAEKEVVSEQIFRDIDMLEQAIYALKKRHNSLCIVERLPKELLATIFKWILSMERDSRSCRWLRVGQVCTEWRRVALDCPALWCFYYTTNLDWLDIVFRRSGTSSLYVHQDLQRKNSKGLRQALSEIKRVRELTFFAYYTTQWEKILEALVKLQPGVPPLLESFNAHWEVYDGNVQTLPENLFTSTPPRLKSLALTGCMIGNNASLLPNLTSLDLGQTLYLQESLPVSLAQLIGILEQAPKLENLKLHHACQKDDGVDDIITRSRIKTVTLSCLRHIDLAGLMCNDILSQIAHPTPLAHIVLHLQIDASSEIVCYMHKLCPTLVTRIRPVHHLQVLLAHETTFEYQCWGQENLSIHSVPSVKPDLNLTLLTDIKQVDRSFMEETILLASLQVLDIAVYHTSITEGFWLAFKDLENLTTIRVRNLAVATFIQALKKMSYMKIDANAKLPSSRYRTKPSFKSLRILIIQEWLFDSTTMDKLLKCLAARRRCGARLQQLNVTESTFSGSDPTDTVAKLRKNVKDVIWDVKIETKEPHIESNPDQDTRSISSNEVERWDYSSPEENFPFSPDEDDS